MTKKKSIITKLFVALVALTLISCCFLGSTFARYTSGGNGSATTNIAKWSIDMKDGSGNTNQFDVTFTDKLSPSKDAWTDANKTTARSHSTGKILVASIANNGDVAASVTVTAAAGTVNNQQEDNNMLEPSLAAPASLAQSDPTISGGKLSGAPSLGQFNDIFEVELSYIVATEAPENGNNATALVSGTAINYNSQGYTLAAKSGSTVYTLYIYAEITWTSLDNNSQSDDTNMALYADLLDTWFGENMTSVKTTLTYTAVQASELPAASGD